MVVWGAKYTKEKRRLEQSDGGRLLTLSLISTSTVFDFRDAFVKSLFATAIILIYLHHLPLPTELLAFYCPRDTSGPPHYQKTQAHNLQTAAQH